jgi:hypothetical protein
VSARMKPAAKASEVAPAKSSKVGPSQMHSAETHTAAA